MKLKSKLMTTALLGLTLMGLTGCIDNKTQAANDVKVEKNSSGYTPEQQNIKKRLELENQPGKIQYFYAFSPMNNTYFYATVEGKVTSSGKSLISQQDYNSGNGVTDAIGQDGTYGSSAPYLYFFDPEQNYYQFYINSAFQVIVSDKPIAIPSNSVKVELTPTKTK